LFRTGRLKKAAQGATRAASYSQTSIRYSIERVLPITGLQIVLFLARRALRVVDRNTKQITSDGVISRDIGMNPVGRDTF